MNAAVKSANSVSADRRVEVGPRDDTVDDPADDPPRPSISASAGVRSLASVASLRMSTTPRIGSTRMTAMKEMKVEITPASPNVRIRPDSDSSSALKASSAVPCASTQAGPTILTANRTA